MVAGTTTAGTCDQHRETSSMPWLLCGMAELRTAVKLLSALYLGKTYAQLIMQADSFSEGVLYDRQRAQYFTGLWQDTSHDLTELSACTTNLLGQYWILSALKVMPKVPKQYLPRTAVSVAGPRQWAEGPHKDTAIAGELKGELQHRGG